MPVVYLEEDAERDSVCFLARRLPGLHRSNDSQRILKECREAIGGQDYDAVKGGVGQRHVYGQGQER